MPSNPAADVRQMIEDVQARHVETEGGQCRSCHVGWPCDAVRLADKLEQALTALEAADSPADVVREIHERATINSYVRWRRWRRNKWRARGFSDLYTRLRASEERYRAAARDARGCVTCSQKWPCDAVRLADRLEQALTALEWYADRENYRCFDGWTGSPADNDEGKRARNALRRMAGGA